MDPLSLLRDCVAYQKPWRIEGEEVVFGDGPGAHRVKKDEPTAWRKTGRKGQSVPVPAGIWLYHVDGMWCVHRLSRSTPVKPTPNPHKQTLRTFTS